MSISSTRKVSSTSESPRKVRLTYGHGGGTDSFVEAVDTSNNIAVRPKLEEEKGKKDKQQEAAQEQQERTINSPNPYVRSAIEALAASGVYEEGSEEALSASRKVGVYNNNQSIIRANEHEKREDAHDYIDDIEREMLQGEKEEVDEFV